MQILRSVAIYPAIRTQQLRRKMSISNLGISFVSYFELSYVEAQCLLKKHTFSSFGILASPRWKINIFVLSSRNKSIVCRAKGRVVSTGAKFLRFQCITSFVVTEPILEPRFPQENQVKVVLVVLLWKWSSIFRMMLASLSEARPGFAIKGACPGALHKLPVTKSNAYIFTKMTRGLPSCVAASIYCFMKFGPIMVCWSATEDISFLHWSCRLRETWRKGLSKAGN